MSASMKAISNTRADSPSGTARIRKLAAGLGSGIHDLGIAEKIYSIVALLVVVATLLVVMSVQSVRLQVAYRQLLATSAAAAINIERVNGLIYAIVMESRGVYMSTEQAKIVQFSDELLKRNRELAKVVAGWELTLRADDAEQFLAFKKRITQFIEFRKELVRRAIQVSPAAGREWGDNDANRTLRTALNVDLEAFARIYDERALKVAELSDQSRYASWYLFALGFSALLLAGLIVLVMRTYIVGPLGQITEATDLIAAGKLELDIPFVSCKNEIGHLARAVENFRDAACRNLELEQLEIGTAKQRDKATGQRDKLNDKYLETKWQLSAALNNMPQGLVMMDSKARILMTNVRFREMYQLPPEMIGPAATLRDILTYRAEHGLFEGNVDEFLKAILGRIASGRPSINEFAIPDGRVFRVSEQPMAGGGWVSTHEDFTEQRRAERILVRTERFLATIIENVSEAIVAKDARDLRYTFVNRAAEKLLGLPRAQILGKSVRDLFPAETAELIEDKDRELLANHQENEVTVRIVDTPNNGRRTLAVRRLRIAGQAGESHIFLSMIEDRTDRANLAEASA
jgi:PAS domain S-box-containing protein